MDAAPRTPPPSRRPPSGFTRADAVITFTLLSVSGLTLFPLLWEGAGSHTPVEIRTILSNDAQRASGRIQIALSLCRQVWGRDRAGTELLGRLDLSTAPLAGTLLPRVPAGDAPPPEKGEPNPHGGNSLFISVEEPTPPFRDLLAGDGSRAVIQPEVQAFTYFFLAPRPGGAPLGGRPPRDLWEWRSVPYADYRQIAEIGDITLRNSLIAALVAGGCAHAFDLSASSPSAAFYALSTDPPWLTALPDHRLRAASLSALTGPSGNVGASGFVYGVSPNTGGAFTHAYPVPAFTAANEDFPSGFEALVWGPPDKRRVVSRLVLAAAGDFKGYGSYEKTASTTLHPARSDAP